MTAMMEPASRLQIAWPLALSCALALGACEKAERVEREAERPLQVVGPAAAPNPSQRERRFLEQLQAYPAAGPERTAFVQAELRESRFSARVAMHVWASGDKALQNDAFGYLVDSEDVALVPLVEEPLPSEPKAVGQGLEQLATAEVELRRKVLLRINALLNDKRDVPAEATSALPLHRVCDEAYVKLRRLVAFPEPDLKQPLEAKKFYASPLASRNATIERVHHLHTWQRILDPNDDSQDDPPKAAPKRAPRPPQLTPMQ